MRCRNFDTRPNTVEVRLDGVAVKSDVFLALRRVMSSFDKSLRLRMNSGGTDTRFGSSSLISLFSLRESRRLLEQERF